MWILETTSGHVFARGDWARQESAKLINIETGETISVAPEEGKKEFGKMNKLSGTVQLLTKTVTTIAVKPLKEGL